MSLKRGIFYTFLTQVPNLLLFFVSSTLMTRILGDEGRGSYALIQSLSTMLSMVLGLNLTFGITYFTAKDKGDPTRMVRVGASLMAVNIVLVPLILLLVFRNHGIGKVFLPGNGTHWGYGVYLLLSIVFGQATSLIGAILLGLKKFKALNRISIINASLSAITFTIMYVFRAHIPPENALAIVLAGSMAYGLTMVLIYGLSYVRIVGILPIPTWKWPILKPVLLFVLVGYLSNFINLINYRFDIWVVASYAGTAQLGLYAVAVGVGQLLFYIPEPFSRVVQPYLYGNMDAALLDRFKFIVRLNFTTVALLSLGLGWTAHWVIPLLYGEAFSASVAALQILLPGIAFISASKLLGLLVVQGGYIRYNLYATAVAAGITIGLDLLLIPIWGISGAALVSSVAYVSLTAVQCAVIYFKMGITVGDMFLLRPSDLFRIRALVTKHVSTLFGR